MIKYRFKVVNYLSKRYTLLSVNSKWEMCRVKAKFQVMQG